MTEWKFKGHGFIDFSEAAWKQNSIYCLYQTENAERLNKSNFPSNKQYQIWLDLYWYPSVLKRFPKIVVVCDFKTSI